MDTPHRCNECGRDGSHLLYAVYENVWMHTREKVTCYACEQHVDPIARRLKTGRPGLRARVFVEFIARRE